MTHPAIAALLAIQPKPLAAADLLHQLYAHEPASVDEMLALEPEIEAAIRESEALANRSYEAVQRCLKLKPVSTTHTPTGF